MKTMFNEVGEFHAKFNLPVAGQQPCRIPDHSTIEYRTNFLEEELQEFKDAVSQGNLVKAVDALADLAWVALGTAHYFHAPFDEAWAEVRRANMEKVLASQLPDAEPHKRGRSEPIRKPPGWREPNLLKVIGDHNRRMKLNQLNEVFPGLDHYSPGANQE